MQKLKLMLTSGLTALVVVFGFQANANAVEDVKVLGRGKVVAFSIPSGTSGFTLLIEGDGTMDLADSYGSFTKDADQAANQAHYGATEESTESVTVQVSVTQPSSRDSSTLQLVLDQEEQSGSELPKVGAGFRLTQGRWGTAPHSAFDSSLRLEKSVGASSNLAFTSEFEYAGEKLHGESARWAQTGSLQDELRGWVGVGGRPRLGLRWGLEGGFAFNPYGATISETPLGLRLGFLRPIEPGNWLELVSKTQALVGLTSVSLSQELGADAAWFRWGTKWGSVSLTAGSGLEMKELNASIIPRLGAQWSTQKAGTVRVRLGFALGDRPGLRLDLGLLPY